MIIMTPIGLILGMVLVGAITMVGIVLGILGIGDGTHLGMVVGAIVGHGGILLLGILLTIMAVGGIMDGMDVLTVIPIMQVGAPAAVGEKIVIAAPSATDVVPHMLLRTHAVWAGAHTAMVVVVLAILVVLAIPAMQT